MDISTIATSILSSSLLIGIYNHWSEKRFAKFKLELEALAKTEDRRWELRRKSCIDALDLVDRAFTNQLDLTQHGVVLEPQHIDVADIRRVYNELALACDGAEVIDLFMTALGMRRPEERGKPFSVDIIQDLRNAIRKELGFGSALELDRSRAWVATFDNKAPSTRKAP